MKLIWFKTTRVGRDTNWEFGCVWPFFLAVAAVVTAVVLILRGVM